VMSEIHFLIRGVRASQMNDPAKLSVLIEFVTRRSRALADEFSRFEPPAERELLAALAETLNTLSDGEVQLELHDMLSLG
jgi:hypothetical protein